MDNLSHLLSTLNLLPALGQIQHLDHTLSQGQRGTVTKLTTHQGHYLIKAIPYTSSNQHKRLVQSQGLVSEMIRQTDATVIAAKMINHLQTHNFEDTWLIQVFDFLEPAHIKHRGKLTPENAHTLGSLLAKIHSTTFDPSNMPAYSTKPPVPLIEWRDYAIYGYQNQTPWAEKLDASYSQLYTLYAQTALSYRMVHRKDPVLEHGDLHHSNVLWQADTPYIIDWDALNSGNRFVFLLRHAMRFSLCHDGVGAISQELFTQFIQGYGHKELLQGLNLPLYLEATMYRLLRDLHKCLDRHVRLTKDNANEQAISQANFLVDFQLNEVLNFESTMKHLPAYWDIASL